MFFLDHKQCFICLVFILVFSLQIFIHKIDQLQLSISSRPAHFFFEDIRKSGRKMISVVTCSHGSSPEFGHIQTTSWQTYPRILTKIAVGCLHLYNLKTSQELVCMSIQHSFMKIIFSVEIKRQQSCLCASHFDILMSINQLYSLTILHAKSQTISQ